MSEDVMMPIQKLFVWKLEEEGTPEHSPLFSEVYVVPLYQRAYAWKREHIEQLIDDMIDSTGTYYLGPLIVAKREKAYEVIDGQQRLTTLYLLLHYLGLCVSKNEARLSFESREKSNQTLKPKTLSALIDNPDMGEADGLDETFRDAIKIISEKFKALEQEEGKTLEDLKKQFQERLSHVVLYRIEVPEHTDLNHYFEVMNTRGEQLTQPDILKARLMNKLHFDKNHDAFARIWEACADMSGYVQLHFAEEDRKQYFNADLEIVADNKFAREDSSTSKQGLTIAEILKLPQEDLPESATQEAAESQFESIIDFPHFLLHTLRVFRRSEYSLDDKHLLETFGDDWDASSVEGFLLCLLQCRYLFDRYIIKRDRSQASDSAWCLKCLNKDKTEVDTFDEALTKKNLMMQAALRVSYTAPKSMNWISTLLQFLYQETPQERITGERLLQETEAIAKKAVSKWLSMENHEQMGVATPHIVFNYLDYRLWNRAPNPKPDFQFAFRNSVEHWYPQHPSEGTFDAWDRVDHFGNLCLIQRSANSRFSNLNPEAKRSTFQEMIGKGSLKLREMRDQMTKDQAWRESECFRHGQEMLDLLKEATEQRSDDEVEGER